MRHAAETLHVTQPAVTYAIQALERWLDAKLFDRRHGGSFLTESGTILARRTRRLRAQLRAAIAAATGAAPDSEAVTRLLRRLSDIHIRTLAAIAGASSFRVAAASLGLAEPTLHRSAHEIEKLLQLALYRRSQSGLVMLPVGAELARRMLLAMVEIRAGLAELRGQSGSGEERITLGILPLAPGRKLAEITRDLLEQHLGLRISLLEGAYDDHIVALRHGAIDMIFGALRDIPPYDDLAAHPIFDDPYCVVCRKGHTLAGRGGIRPADLSRFGWVFPTPSLPRRAVLDAILREWGLAATVQVETNSPSAITASILASERLGLWPRSYVDGEMSLASLAVLDLTVPQPRRQVGVTHRKDWLPTHVQAAFLSRLLAGSGGVSPLRC